MTSPVHGGKPVDISDETIFAQAMEKDSPTERAAYLDQACGDNVTLRKQVEELLAAHEAAGDFLQSPAAEEFTMTHLVSGSARGELSAGTLLEGPGTKVGAYHLLEQIGEGGFGVVYRAEQKEPVQRQVALKIIKPGMDSAEIIGRFESERQALAIMDHANIARVLDGGATSSGRPYFVMELVRGIPITDYCDEFNLTPQERLQLFIPVCEAIQHAHQKGIIHRDIKPTNILVTVYEGKAIPKVIDFGVAKATRQPLTQRTLHTQAGQIIGTLQYMSPEQAGMSELDVDTRSDVYSLGVVLYELLTGSTPIDRDRLRSASYDELQRMIRDEEPLKPSTRINQSTATLPTIAAHRRSDPKKLGKLFRGDLDWIVMKALEKDRTRRYASAMELALDLRRHLRDEPVEARPPSTTYKLHKFARRHKSLLGVAAAVCLILVLATTVSTWLAIRASLAEAAALRAKAELQETNQIRIRALVQSLWDAAPANIPSVVNQMSLNKPEILTELRRHDVSRLDQAARSRRAYALAMLGDHDPQLNEMLVQAICLASEAELSAILAATTGPHRDLLPMLARRAAEESDAQVRLRLAVVALHLGDAEPARQMLAFAGDPHYRTTFIHGLPLWRGEVSRWSDWLRSTDDSAFRSGICLSLGLLPLDHIGPAEWQSLKLVMSDLYQSAPDAATHSAAQYVFDRWKIPPPSLEQRTSAAAHVDWFVNGHGMTMVRVNGQPPGSFQRQVGDPNEGDPQFREVTLTQPFFVCDREVWESLFAQFLRETGYTADPLPDGWQELLSRRPEVERLDPNAERPVWQVNFDDAVHFCNWLSQKEGRDICYLKLGEHWQCDFDADGYRLPTEAEWEFAARAGTQTPWHFGDDVMYLRSYALYLGNAQKERWPGRSRLPNDFGLFDLYGNVCEWCWDWYAPYPIEDLRDPLGPPDGTRRMFRGGGSYRIDDECRSATRRSLLPSSRFTDHGFRVVCGDTTEIDVRGQAPP